jgi:hypothetical protein
LFPANEDDKDFISCYQNCHKLALLQQIVCGNWSALEVQRLVLDPTFQGFLVHLKDRQTYYRRKYPEKPELLRMCFHKTIGATKHFKFDVSSGCPAWVSDCTPDEELRWKLRSEAKAAKAEADAQANWANKRANAIMKLKTMDFDEVHATGALEATLGDVDAAIALLLE